MQLSVAYIIRPLLATLCDHPESFTPEQLATAGQIARRLLTFAWEQTNRDSMLVTHALQAVCRTFESDRVASAALLRRALAPTHMTHYAFEEMYWLTREIARLIKADPELVKDIYVSTFRHEESSDAETPMGHSQILPLVSNRKQDFHMAQYQLAEIYPKFLAHAPIQATRALMAVLDAYVTQCHPPASGEILEEEFDWDGLPAYLRTDGSSIWDEGDTYRHDEPLKILDAFEEYLVGLTEVNPARTPFPEVLEILVRESRLAVLWRLLLRLGKRFPETAGRSIRPLAWTKLILTAYDTMPPAGEFLTAIFPHLDPTDRERIERAIMSIPDAFGPDKQEASQHVRDRLLGCLPETALVTSETSSLLAGLKARKAVPRNEPRMIFSGVTRTPYGEEESLARQGVPIMDEANLTIRRLEAPIEEFLKKDLRSEAATEELAVMFPALQALQGALQRANEDGVHPRQSDYAWGHLATACVKIAGLDEVLCRGQIGVFMRQVLLEASVHAAPIYDSDDDAAFDDGPSWGGGIAQIEAATGLVLLARHSSCLTEDVVQAIERLSSDPVPAVRYQIARRLTVLYGTAREHMWRILERLCREEQSRGVLQAVLENVGRLAGADIDRVVTLAKTIFDRVLEGPGAERVRELCIQLFTDLYVWRDNALCRQIVFEIAANPTARPRDAREILPRLRDPVTHGETDPTNLEQDAVRQRALTLCLQLLRSGTDGLRAIEAASSGTLSDGDKERIRGLYQLLDGIGSEVYFASGAFENGKRELTVQKKQRFYQEATPLLEGLADVGLPSIAHHLVDTLTTFVTFDARTVFLLVVRTVRAGEKGGYQYESLAVDRIVSLVERYLAEYRTLLQEDEACRLGLMELLDIFVQAGWPNARQLTYRLDDIFR